VNWSTAARLYVRLPLDAPQVAVRLTRPAPSLVVGEVITEGARPNIAADGRGRRRADTVGESVTKVFRCDARSTLSGRVDVHVVVAHVVREAVKHQGLVQDLIKCFAQLLLSTRRACTNGSSGAAALARCAQRGMTGSLGCPTLASR